MSSKKEVYFNSVLFNVDSIKKFTVQVVRKTIDVVFVVLCPIKECPRTVLQILKLI